MAARRSARIGQGSAASAARRGLRALLVAGATVVLTLGWLRFRLRPPAFDIPTRGATLENVTVVEPGRHRLENRTIRVDGGRITAVDPAAPNAEGPYAGRFVLPGLIDMHVHHPPNTLLGDVELFGLLFLAHGVTAVRDMGNFDGTILDSRERIRRGAAAGPRIFACGPILDGAPPFWPGSRVVRSAAEARRAVRELVRAGVDCIKVYERLSPDALRAIHDAAAAAGLPVVGHVPHSVGFREARLDDVQHLTGILERSESRLTEARLRSIITTSAVLDIAHTPTLVMWAKAARLSDDARLRGDPGVRTLPRYFRDVLWVSRSDPRYRDLSAADWMELARAPENARRVARRLYESGIRLRLGTDTMAPFVLPGSSLHEEMHEFEGLGMSPEEVWAAATWQAGEALGEPGLGRILEGAPADLLVFGDDPTRDLSALQTLEAVVADGRLYPVEELEDALALRRAHDESGLVERISMQGAAMASPGRS